MRASELTPKLTSQNLFFARSNKAPKGWSYDHVGFITQDGKQIQMSGHRGNDVYITNAVTDDSEFPKQSIKIVKLSKPVHVPTTNTVGAENCGTFVEGVLRANGITGIDTAKLYSIFKQPSIVPLEETESGPNFKKSLLTILQQQYPTAKFNLRPDRVESVDGKLTVIGAEMVGKIGRTKYVGIYLWDVATGSYTGALVPAIKQTTEQLLLANPRAKPALFLGGDNENPEAWNHIATKLGYRIIDDEEEDFEELN